MKLTIKRYKKAFYFIDQNQKLQGIDYDEVKGYWISSSLVGYVKNNKGLTYYI